MTTLPTPAGDGIGPLGVDDRGASNSPPDPPPSAARRQDGAGEREQSRGAEDCENDYAEGGEPYCTDGEPADKARGNPHWTSGFLSGDRLPRESTGHLGLLDSFHNSRNTYIKACSGWNPQKDMFQG